MKEADNYSRPVAKFLIERVPGIGYSITSSSGPESSALEKDALKLLDNVKQPNADQVGVTSVWLGPIGEKPYFVGVTTNLKATGDVQFTQFWFVQKKPRVINTLLLLGLFLALPLGIYIGSKGITSKKNSTTVNIVPDNKQSDSNVLVAPQENKNIDDLLLLIGGKETKELHKKITEFLEQEGLAADPDLQVQRFDSIKIIDDLDGTPRIKVQSIKLDNFEVRTLLDLLDRTTKLVPSRTENNKSPN